MFEYVHPTGQSEKKYRSRWCLFLFRIFNKRTIRFIGGSVSGKVQTFFRLFSYHISLHSSIYLSMYRMSMISISGITLWIGQSNENGPSVAQMTRKISHFAIHNGYNSLNYVNCHITSEN